MGKLRASEIFRNPRLLLIAIESISFQYNKTVKLSHLSGKIEPIAVIVCSPDRTYALDMEAKPAPFEKLREDVPELDDMITSLECPHKNGGF